jgi:hypothetical protein
MSNNFIKRNLTQPNYIPVKNMEDFNYDVIAYYNQYYASPYVTQQRRNLRNYLMTQNDIKVANQNNYVNNQDKKFYFFYTLTSNFMLIVYQNKGYADLFMVVNKTWNYVKRINNCNVGSIINNIKGENI